ncbi:MAG: CorA family divalent cation transporter [Patescibacteria group bacterium]|nr:CorA family divalent cation transporter [Patescibacteria group bacterium]
MRKIIKYNDLIWVDIVEPTEEDGEYLKNNFRLHPLVLTTLLPPVRHPDIEIFRNYLFIILHRLILNKEDMEVQELDIIAGKNFLVTSHYKIIQPLNSIFEECLKSKKAKMDYLKKGIGYLLFTILKKLLREKLTEIDEIENEIDLLEKEIFSGKKGEIIKKVSLLKTKILDFWRVIGPQKIIFFSLKNAAPKLFDLDFQPYYFSLFRIYRAIEDTIKNSKETIESLEETSHILVTFSLNEIMKILTIFSALLLPPTLLASIWGMNTELPLSQLPFGFWLIILIMVIVFSVIAIYFKIKKWF